MLRMLALMYVTNFLKKNLFQNVKTQAKLVSSGYSQGGQLVHNSAAMLSSAVLNRINAVVIFVSA